MISHNKQSKATHHHHLRRLTFSPFQRKSELPQVGFEPTSLFLWTSALPLSYRGSSVVVGHTWHVCESNIITINGRDILAVCPVPTEGAEGGVSIKLLHKLSAVYMHMYM